MSDESTEDTAKTGLARWCLLVLGLLFTALGAAGALLSVLPTTPFLLLASACFVRSSPAFHRRLLANRLFGPYIARWQYDRTVPREAKRKAHCLVLATFARLFGTDPAVWDRLFHATSPAHAAEVLHGEEPEGSTTSWTTGTERRSCSPQGDSAGRRCRTLEAERAGDKCNAPRTDTRPTLGDGLRRR